MDKYCFRPTVSLLSAFLFLVLLLLLVFVKDLKCIWCITVSSFLLSVLVLLSYRHGEMWDRESCASTTEECLVIFHQSKISSL